MGLLCRTCHRPIHEKVRARLEWLQSGAAPDALRQRFWMFDDYLTYQLARPAQSIELLRRALAPE
jgi:hypothetical protein